MPKISDQLDQTIRELEQLHQPGREFKAAMFAELQAAVSRLDDVPPPLEDDEPAPMARPRRPAEQPSIPADGTLPFGVELPSRTTHGGPFGPAVRRRLIAEALEKGGW